MAIQTRLTDSDALVNRDRLQKLDVIAHVRWGKYVAEKEQRIDQFANMTFSMRPPSLPRRLYLE